jgi:hypothetical protein
VRDFTDRVWEKAHLQKDAGVLAGNRAAGGVRQKMSYCNNLQFDRRRRWLRMLAPHSVDRRPAWVGDPEQSRRPGLHYNFGLFLFFGHNRHAAIQQLGMSCLRGRIPLFTSDGTPVE